MWKKITGYFRLQTFCLIRVSSEVFDESCLKFRNGKKIGLIFLKKTFSDKVSKGEQQ